MRRILVVLALLCTLLIQPNQASAQNPVAVNVEGPGALPPGQTAAYYVNISGGPAEVNGTYSVRWWIEAGNTAGATPLAGTPGSQSSSTKNSFIANVTVPTHEGDVDLIFEATSGNTTTNTTVKRTLVVHVLSPLVLTAAFANNGGAAVVNATVNFYVDGNFVGSKVITRINPGERGTAAINWIPVGLGPGQHTVRAEADINHDGKIEESVGEVTVTEIFYKTGGEPAAGYLGVLAILIGLVGIIILLAYRRRAKNR